MTTRDDFLKKRREIIESEFSKLNPAQREAVLSPAGQTLILAGAGSGKTTVIVNRIACLIKYGDACYSPEVPFGGDPEDDLRLITDLAEGKEQPEHERFRAKQLMQHNAPPPWAVMAITFTNKAAQELKDRLAAMLGDAAGEIWASTFHSACAKILRRESSEGKTGYGPDFAIYDTDDTARTIKECYKALSVDEKTLPVKFTASRISRAKDRLIGPEEFESEIAGNDAMLRQVGRVYKEYRKRLRSSNAMDFDDIIFNTVELFDKDPDVLEKYRRRFKYILVDEYQDTNAAQFRLINLLAGEKGNLCVVGDDDQSIYKFRGATVENIINFDTQYPAAKVVRLEQNYRSTSNILAAANSVIKNNLSRRSKTLWTAKKGGEKLTEYCGGNERDEAQYIGAQILRGLGEGRKACDFAVLYRSNAQSNVIETTFSKMGIGYRVVGGHRFYDRAEIKDMLSYLCVINNPSDTLRLTRIINVPRRGIGASTVTAAARIAAAESISLFDVIRRAGKYGELSKAAGRLTAFAEMIEELRADSEKLSLSELYQEVLDRTGYLNMYLEENTPESADRAENLRELMSSVEAYEDENENASLRSFLEEAALMSDIDNYDSEEDACVMMTLHAAKGLEFPVVFIAGMEEGVFPGNQVMYDPGEIEEERRLAYVGITRAKEKLFLTRAASRTLYGQTFPHPASRFIGEIDGGLLEHEGIQTAAGGRRGQTSWEDRDDDFVSIPAKAAVSRPAGTGMKKPFLGSIYGERKKPPVLSAGDRVRHKAFGDGVVMSVREMGNDSLVEVKFDSVGTKKLMLNFAPLEKL